jgi:hypothetical protein
LFATTLQDVLVRVGEILSAATRIGHRDIGKFTKIPKTNCRKFINDHEPREDRQSLGRYNWQAERNEKGTKIRRGGQRLGVYEAPRRRRLIDLTSRIPQPLTIYVYDILTVCTIRNPHIRREKERKGGRERAVSYQCRKDIILMLVLIFPHAV